MLSHIKSHRLEILLFSFIIGIGIFLRFYHLDSTPPGLYADVAANGLDGLNVSNGSDIRVLYPRNAGREGMFFWLLGILQTIITKHYVVMYLLTALIGIATLFIHYKVIKDFFGKNVGLLGTFLLGASFYHMHYSRLGYRTILVPIFILGTFYATQRMLLYAKSRKWAAAAGFIFGMGIYTYLSYRTFMLAVFLSLAYFYLRNRSDWRIHARNFMTFIGTFILTIIPYIVAALQDWHAAFGRSSDVSGPGLFEGIFETLKIFGFEGDPEMQYNIPNMPLMGLFLSTMFILGFIFLFKKYWKNYEFAFIFLTVGSQLGIIAITDRTPHLLRAVGMTAFIYTIAAYGFIELTKYFRSRIVKEAKFNFSFIAYSMFLFSSLIFFAYIPFNTFNSYFNVWAKQESIDRKEFFADYVALGNYLNSKFDDFSNITIFSTYFPSEDLYWKDTYPLQTTNYILRNDSPGYAVEWFDSIETAELNEYVFLKLDDERSMTKFINTINNYKFIDLVYLEDLETPVYAVYSKI